MTHKRTEHARAFRVLRLFLAIVTVLLAPATPTASASTSPLFLPVASYSSGGAGTNSVAAADLNGDGKVDLVVVNQCGNGAPNDCPSGTVGVLLGIGNGTFQSTSYGSGGFAARSVAVGDMDGDGKPDLIVANQCGSDNTCQTHSASVGVLLGNGNGTFQPAATYDSGGFAGAPLASTLVLERISLKSVHKANPFQPLHNGRRGQCPWRSSPLGSFLDQK